MHTKRMLGVMMIALIAAVENTGCTIKAVGDPARPITINAHVTVDVRGLQNTATNIEDYVSGKTDEPFQQ